MVTAEVPQSFTVAQRVRWARRRAGLSQERLAERIGTSRRHVIRWEKGKHMPSRAYAVKIAEATNTTPELFHDEEDDEEEDAVRKALDDLYVALRQQLRHRELV